MTKETLASLKKLAKGTGIKIAKIPGTDNVVISCPGTEPQYKQVGSNVGVSATEVVKAMKVIKAIEKKDRARSRK